ncbi:MAG: amino acid permease [Calditrichales bacterium]|nr:MAG: amino acid permease [Calditrichales bacterium]
MENKTQKMGYFGTLSLVVGNIIGVGIFTTTGYITGYIQSPVFIMLAWLIGALYALSGAKVYSVLVSEYPLTGGDYQYLGKSLHPLAGYLFGWSALFITYSGSIAALGIAAAYYLDGIVHIPGLETGFTVFSFDWFEMVITVPKLLAIGFILIFTWINYRGILLSEKYQIALTSAIFILLVIFSFAGSISTNVDYSRLFSFTDEDIAVSGFLVSLIAVLFSYIGWTTAVYVAEEIDQADKIIPRALKIGVLAVGIIYIWVNMVYLIALPVSEMGDVINIATRVSEKLWGGQGSFIISAIILVAVFSSLNSTILSGPRIYYAMGREGYLGGLTRKIHPRFGSPSQAIMIQAFWSILLVLSGSFNQLLSFIVFVILAFSMLSAMISVKILFRRNKLSIGNLVSTGFYTLFCFVMMVNTMVEKPAESLIGIGLILIAFPFYLLDKKLINNRNK